jgi:predicted metal-binding membrane protein
MQSPAPWRVWRSNPAIWSILLLAAALGWVVTVQQALSMAGMSADTNGMSGSMSSMPGSMQDVTPSPTSLLVFLPVWVAMMSAMMFPAIAPVVTLVSAAGRKRRLSGGRGDPAAVFVAGYLFVWTLFGLAAYLLSLAIPSLDMAAPGIRSANPLIAGLILIAAGLYEWSPLKSVCLRHCRSPLGAFVTLWRDGWYGAFRMGVVHGSYCLGCCWGLMLVLFAVGLMNLTAMVLLAGAIFAQKVLPRGDLISRAVGAALVLTGLGVTFAPVL